MAGIPLSTALGAPSSRPLRFAKGGGLLPSSLPPLGSRFRGNDVEGLERRAGAGVFLWPLPRGCLFRLPPPAPFRGRRVVFALTRLGGASPARRCWVRRLRAPLRFAKGGLPPFFPSVLGFPLSRERRGGAGTTCGRVFMATAMWFPFSAPPPAPFQGRRVAFAFRLSREVGSWGLQEPALA